MVLNELNYYSKEANIEYMSVSQYKNFSKCESKALYDLKNDFEDEKTSYLEGQLFEELVAGDPDLFIAKHRDELIAKTGKTAGEYKANFKTVFKSAEKFNNQKFFRDIIDKSQKQVILTGTINGVKIKGRLDLLDLNNKLIPDIKCMANFEDVWSKKDKRYKPWYYTYDYVLQMAIYQELVRQNYGIICDTALLAASKESEPDLVAPKFDNELLKLELEKFSNKVVHYNNLKLGLAEPKPCLCCDYCKTNKIITNFDIII